MLLGDKVISFLISKKIIYRYLLKASKNKITSFLMHRSGELKSKKKDS